MAEVLGQFISKKWEEGVWKGVQIAAGVNSITHLQFTDDTFLAGDATTREAQVMKETLDIYEKASGQKVNWNKSEIFFFNTKPCKQREVCKILSMKVGSLPGKYLGIPFFGDANKFDLWKNLIDSCINKMDGWKSRWLTLVGRISMLRTVVSTIPIYSMMCLKIPKKAKIRGGAGLRDWHKMNTALGAKLVWNIYTNPNQMWVKVLRAKYLDSPDDHRVFTIRNPPRGSAIWNFIMDCQGVVMDHLTWQIGKGTKAKFWEDSWAGFSAIRELGDFLETKEHFVQLWGDKVKDYMRCIEGEIGKEWVWKDLSTTSLLAQLQQRLRDVLDQRKLFLTGTKDRVIWHGSVASNKGQNKKVLEARWKPPEKGWFKVNFDGAAQTSKSLVGAGLAMWNDNGYLIKCGAKRLTKSTNNEAEVQATLLVAGLARSQGVRNLHLEGDSLIIIQAIMNGEIKAWHLEGFIAVIKEELIFFENFKISHIRREGNQTADKLSKWALSFDLEGEVKLEDFQWIPLSGIVTVQ
ncbi:uncharacterized protein LOC131044985 [Cryptomeria japonica]|uniref:uncharacterized protein LOC131044985 n=1 Tax=Cryptomeria japonica TaxID=3369 RepID=UPI0027DA7AF1|nr:uncharacterized protein LOC131044985 [Cryptomeria japonica]